MILRLTDGTTTVSLVGGPVRRRQYALSSPEISVLEYVPINLADGGEAAAITRRNITETCEITITDDTEAEVQTVIRNIELLFLGAIEYQNRRGGARLYVEFAPNDAWDVHRSEILYGRLELGEEALSTWAQTAVEVKLFWQRRYYWEGPEGLLTLTNSAYSGSTGVPVTNCNDGSNDNYVEIDGAAVAGTLPAPVILTLENDYNNGDATHTIVIGHNVYADPGDLVPILEGEDADGVTGSGDATCSGGEYAAGTWAVDTQVVVFAWTLDSADLSHYRGRFFRLWARLRTLPADGIYAQAKIMYPILMGNFSTVNVVAEAAEMLLAPNNLLQDLGVLQVPPWLMGDASTLDNVILTLCCRTIGGSTLDLDFIQLTPLDSYRELRPRVVFGLEYNDVLTDDGIGGAITVEATSKYTGLFYATGLPIMLIPGRDQRLYFLMTSDAGGAEIDRTLTVTASYRPRRVTL